MKYRPSCGGKTFQSTEPGSRLDEAPPPHAASDSNFRDWQIWRNKKFFLNKVRPNTANHQFPSKVPLPLAASAAQMG